MYSRLNLKAFQMSIINARSRQWTRFSDRREEAIDRLFTWASLRRVPAEGKTTQDSRKPLEVIERLVIPAVMMTSRLLGKLTESFKYAELVIFITCT